MKRSKHDKKMRWIGENMADLEASYPGMWVAISDEGLAGVGESAEAAEAEARSKGCDDPLLTGIKRREYQGIFLIRKCH